MAALNAKYIHSNPGIYSMAAYATKQEPKLGEHIRLGEYTINHSRDSVLADIYRQRPMAVGFSCYIWNIDFVLQLTVELHKILPETDIWLGGPEVSYDAEKLLDGRDELTGIMVGEGEETFLRLMKCYDALGSSWLAAAQRENKIQVYTGIENEKSEAGTGFREQLLAIPGLVLNRHITATEHPVTTAPNNLMQLSELPFLYDHPERFENRIIYYESSRGCPFRCSYCLSSIDKQVRFRDIEIVKRELQFFLDHRVKQVKFVDRTFNASHSHAIAIWRYIKEHDNGVTNFHFEIGADILNEEELALINSFRPGAVQMEIGVQSTNERTIAEINRSMDVAKLTEIVARLHGGHNVHIHLDLIAGLPYEDFASFRNSFNAVYAMEPEQLQLGFLKVLKGSKMHDKAEEYGIVYTDTAPYEVLYTRWLTYDDVLCLKQIEEMVELYYNSNQFSVTLLLLVGSFETPFDFFLCLADYYEEMGYRIQVPSRIFRYEVLLNFTERHRPELVDRVRESLTVDLYLRENLKSRPAFCPDIQDMRESLRAFQRMEAEEHRYLTGEAYRDQDAKALARMTHIEPVSYDLETGDPLPEVKYLLFDYTRRNPLTYDATVYQVEVPGNGGL